MKIQKIVFTHLLLLSIFCSSLAQNQQDSTLLTIDKIFNSSDFRQDYPPELQWIEKGEAYVILEPVAGSNDKFNLVKYETASQKSTVMVTANDFIPAGDTRPLSIEGFSFSPDESKLLLFTNSSRVWRSYTKGDYWVFDLTTRKLKKLGSSFPSSSLMFAKFSNDGKSVAYVYAFNIYIENFSNGKTIQLTPDGTGDIINGTFDWVYEEEFGCRDGFRWNSSGKYIAYWQLNASDIGTFYMINNTDSVYSKIIPLQYPVTGQEPSACRVGYIDVETQTRAWIPVPGDDKENYIPRMQWINNELLLIQQINRKQNHLIFYTFNVPAKELKKIYEEKEDTWVDIDYPDVSSDSWEMEDLVTTNDNRYVLRMSENDGWRHIYKIDILSGKKTLLTPGNYDVAKCYSADKKYVYFNASPNNTAQRYLYRVSLNGTGDTLKMTPSKYSGVNLYNISGNNKYAVHVHTSTKNPPTFRLISISDHKTIKTLVDNEAYIKNIHKLLLPTDEFFGVTTEDGIKIDGIMTKPPDFDPGKKYPVLFYVYGEPAAQLATDTWGNLWLKMLAQQGYIIITIDNRGTPCLNGSEWRKSIYRKIGVINSRDQAMAAKEILKWNFIDPERIAVWGWSGGGSMTLNLMFRYPEIYKTGMAVAALTDLRTYDNIYQERYMGLPSENHADYVEGSPVTYAKNLVGNLLVVHGTGDDNVHYQNLELLANELIKNNRQFTMMAYPNRTHGIYEGMNTRRHLFTLLTNYLKTNTPPGGR